MNLRELFALYVESAGPGPLAAAVCQRHGAASVAIARAECAGRITVRQSRIGDIEDFLGRADERTATTLGYELSLRPGYYYTFEFNGPDGLLVRHGYRRVGPPPAAPARLVDHSTLRAQLAAIGATMSEVRSWLGEPSSEDGWWPIDDWTYPDGLVIEFRHGVVEASS